MELGPARRMPDTNSVRKIIALELEDFVRKTRLRRLYFADSSVAPPPLGYITHFPRLSIPLEGSHVMDLPVGGRSERILPARGHAVFVPGHSSNRAELAKRVKGLTVLFGAKQIGISLV